MNKQPQNKNAVVLLSGGLDSATTAAMALKQGYNLSALTMVYGQRANTEVEAAKAIANSFGIKDHRIAEIDLKLFGESALTSDIDVPKGRSDDEMSAEIPVTYVPARNTIFLSYALAFAEVKKANRIFIGVNAVDYSGYPDCRPEFIDAFQALANLATKAGVEGNMITVETPLIDMTKAEIIKSGTALNVDYALTLSCYDPDENGLACGECDSCILRKRGFKDANIPDPTRYQTS